MFTNDYHNDGFEKAIYGEYKFHILAVEEFGKKSLGERIEYSRSSFNWLNFLHYDDDDGWIALSPEIVEFFMVILQPYYFHPYESLSQASPRYVDDACTENPTFPLAPIHSM